MSPFDELRQLLERFSQGEAPENEIARLLLGPECRLLQGARQWLNQGDLFAEGSLPDWPGFEGYISSLLRPEDPRNSPLAARVKLIRAAQSEAAAEQIADQVRHAIQIYRTLQAPADWSPETLRINRRSHGGDASDLPYPAWHAALPNDNFRQCFDQLANEFGWFDPALAMAGRTLAWLHSAASLNHEPDDQDPQPASRSSTATRKAVTNVLLVANLEGGETGLVGRLILRTVPGGCGYLYADPLSTGYLASPDGSFQQSLRNAWFQVMRPEFRQVNYDVVWSLVATDPESGLPAALHIQGRSAELALACALRAIVKNEDLDPWTVVTGQFADPLDPHNQHTDDVAGIESKLRAPEFGSRLQAADLSDLVLDRNQRPDDSLIHKATVHRVTTFNEAYEQLAGWAVMTRTANQLLAEHAARLLQSRCQADAPNGYVLSPLSRLVKEAARLAGESEQWKPVADRDQVVTASWDATRVAFFADSGVGKTTLLIHCEHRIAAAQTGLLPIRYDKLSERAWDNEDQFWTRLANQYRSYVPRHKDDVPRIKQWLLRLRDKGRLVFLLDALDQTDEAKIQQLHEWLTAGGGVQDCRVYVTGRPWTRQSRLFDSPDPDHKWTVVRVNLLAREQIRLFLTKEREARLRHYFPKGDSDEDQENDVLRVPVVLDLLKTLAAGPRLEQLTNRERIYHAALEGARDERTQSGGLLGKGVATAKDSPFANVQPGSELQRQRIAQLSSLLACAAWHMVRQGNFLGTAAGPDFTTIVDGVQQIARQNAWGDKVLEYLQQMGVFQIREVHDIVDGSTDALEWRHLSFCEYFAGVHLAEALTTEEQTEALAEVLDNLRARRRIQELSPADQQQAVSPYDRWRWVFRFALSRACANARKTGDSTRLNHLAGQLIAHGNPYVVYESMTEDGIEKQPDGSIGPLDGDIGRLARWLVHRTQDHRDLRVAWKSDDPPKVSIKTLGLLRPLFDRRYRNGPVLPPAWQLVQSQLPAEKQRETTDLQKVAVEIRDSFFGDLEGMRASGSGLAADERVLLQDFLETFVACPPEGFDFTTSGDQLRQAANGQYEFRMGASPDDKDAMANERPRHWVELSGIEMADFCITNGLLELMDPSHYWYRDEYSRNDDQPALYVNWYTARLYGTWLSGVAARLLPGSGYEYRLPTECEWEFAARGGSGKSWWWGAQFSSEHCNSLESGLKRTLGRSETTPDYCNGFGLYHMSGNNWQWCLDVFDGRRYAKRTAGSAKEEGTGEVLGVRPADEGEAGVGGRVCRGGSFNLDARYCRSSYRCLVVADLLDYDMGFRLCRALSCSESSSDTLTSDGSRAEPWSRRKTAMCMHDMAFPGVKSHRSGCNRACCRWSLIHEFVRHAEHTVVHQDPRLCLLAAAAQGVDELGRLGNLNWLRDYPLSPPFENPATACFGLGGVPV